MSYDRNQAGLKSGTVDFELSVERQPNGQFDVVATPKSAGLRTVCLARCRSRRVAQALVEALVAKGVMP